MQELHRQQTDDRQQLVEARNKIAEVMSVDRIGPMHQAGSDSLLTLDTFMKMVKLHFKNNLDNIEKHCTILYGLGSDATTGTQENGFTEAAI